MGAVVIGWRKYFWRAAFASQSNMILRMAGGLWVFRLLYGNLSPDVFGFYMLLWSMLGYTTFLDFGLGYTTQKVTAEKVAKGDVEGLNGFISTVFLLFAGVGCFIFVVAVACGPILLTCVKVPPTALSEFFRAYLIFVAAFALAFPLGFLAEILAGLQRSDLVSWAGMASAAFNVVFITIGVWSGWGLSALVLVGVLCWHAQNVLVYLMIRRAVAGFSLAPRFVDFSLIFDYMSFSVSTYAISCSNFVAARTDQAVISFTLGVAQLCPYQVGFKVADIFKQVFGQTLRPLSAAAAQLHARGDSDGLRNLLMGSLRLALLILPAYAFVALHLRPLVGLLTGVKSVDHNSLVVGQLLLAAGMSMLVTESCVEPILVMTGGERRVALAKGVNAVVNLVLSVFLVYRVGLPGAALGTLIPGALIGWAVMVPMGVRLVGGGLVLFLQETVGKIWKPVGLSMILLTLFMGVPGHFSLVATAFEGCVVVIPVGLVGWRLGRQLVTVSGPVLGVLEPSQSEVEVTI